jgi:hypothetical protein
VTALFTIGYERATPPALLAALRAAGVRRVVDVRALANSRRPGFAKRALSAALEEAGIGYLHLRALGTPPEGREAVRAGRPEVMRRVFARHLAGVEAQAALAALADEARRWRTRRGATGRSACCASKPIRGTATAPWSLKHWLRAAAPRSPTCMREPTMPICLVLHELGLAGPAAETAFFGAIFEVASSHWRVTPGATLVGTDVSPAYLRDHLLHALDAAGAPPAVVLVTPMAADAAWHGIPPEGEEWIAGEAED